jgi:hypothetical protein
MKQKPRPKLEAAEPPKLTKKEIAAASRYLADILKYRRAMRKDDPDNAVDPDD